MTGRPKLLDHLVTRASALRNHTLQLVDLLLGTAKSTEPLLGQLARTLVLAVAEQFDNTLLVGGETSDLLDDLTDERSALREVALAAADAGLGVADGGLEASVLPVGDARLLNGGHCWC